MQLFLDCIIILMITSLLISMAIQVVAISLTLLKKPPVVTRQLFDAGTVCWLITLLATLMFGVASLAA